MVASVFGALTFISCRRAVIEALAMGRRVVAFEGGGISEILSVINREVRANTPPPLAYLRFSPSIIKRCVRPPRACANGRFPNPEPETLNIKPWRQAGPGFGDRLVLVPTGDVTELGKAIQRSQRLAEEEELWSGNHLNHRP